MQLDLSPLSNIKIAHKGLLLVLLPLAINLLFFWILALQLSDAEYQIGEERRNKEIVTRMNDLSMFSMDAMIALVNYKSSRDEANMRRFDDVSARVIDELKELRGLVKNSDDLAAVDSLERTTKVAAAILSKCKFQLATGDKLAALTYGPVLIAAGHKVYDTCALIKGPYRQKEEEALNAHDQSRKRIRFVLVVGILMNIIIAFSLGLFFAKNITGRIRTLAENSLRLSREQTLNQPMKGSDELASLDRAFHKMANRLAQVLADLRASEERVRLVIEHMPVGILTVNQEGIIESINPRTEQIIGCKPDQILKQPLSKVLPQAQTEAEFLSDLENKIGRTVDTQALRAGGGEFPAEISVNRYQTNEGDRFLVNMQDVTERHEIERLKQEFVSMVSHDLRTPLTSVQGTLSLLEEGLYGELTETGVKRVGTAVTSIDRLINLINDLLDIEKLEAGKLAMDPKSTSATEIIERSVESVRGFAEQHGVLLEALPSDLHVLADCDRLVQVLVNLLSNAIKFSPEGATVTVAALRQDKFAEFTVADRGRGIPPSHVEAIFERFKQVKSADGARKKGTGLGLAISKAIAEAHGGTIGVKSEEGKGSTFWFRIPLS